MYRAAVTVYSNVTPQVQIKSRPRTIPTDYISTSTYQSHNNATMNSGPPPAVASSKKNPRYPSKNCKYAGVTFREYTLCSFFCFFPVHIKYRPSHTNDTNIGNAKLAINRRLTRQVPSSNIQGQQGIQPRSL